MYSQTVYLGYGALSRDRLRGAPLFQRFSAALTEKLLDELDVALFSAGDLIVKEGQKAEVLYFLHRGEAEVLCGPRGEHVARLEGGAFFGEMALFHSGGGSAAARACGRRTATVRATTFCDCRSMSFRRLRAVLAEFPEERAVFEGTATQRLQDLEIKRRRAQQAEKAEAAEAIVKIAVQRFAGVRVSEMAGKWQLKCNGAAGEESPRGAQCGRADLPFRPTSASDDERPEEESTWEHGSDAGSPFQSPSPTSADGQGLRSDGIDESPTQGEVSCASSELQAPRAAELRAGAAAAVAGPGLAEGPPPGGRGPRRLPLRLAIPSEIDRSPSATIKAIEHALAAPSLSSRVVSKEFVSPPSARSSVARRQSLRARTVVKARTQPELPGALPRPLLDAWGCVSDRSSRRSSPDLGVEDVCDSGSRLRPRKLRSSKHLQDPHEDTALVGSLPVSGVSIQSVGGPPREAAAGAPEPAEQAAAAQQGSGRGPRRAGGSPLANSGPPRGSGLDVAPAPPPGGAASPLARRALLLPPLAGGSRSF